MRMTKHSLESHNNMSMPVTNPTTPVLPAKPRPLAICIRDLRVNYGKFEAVKGISLDIPHV